MNALKPYFIGYFPKSSLNIPEGLDLPDVSEIYSVSHCISKPPQDWITHWKHNVLGFYESEAVAWKVTSASADEFEMFAYKLFPFEFHEGKRRSFNVPVSLNSRLSDYDFCGYDVVSRSSSDFFECSPLSCNLAAREFPVNQYCLIDDLTDALVACVQISAGEYEPGSYYLFDVYRKMKDTEA